MQNLAEKVISRHLVAESDDMGGEVAVRIDQTLTQDATGTMAYLQFEAMGVEQVKTELSVSYVDHNTLQVGFENADDHKYLQTVAMKHGLLYSRAGNGICHQVHLERFGVPGKTLLGADSHTPTGGGLGMLAIGAGGVDVALAMAGQPFHFPMPKIVNVRLTGKLPSFVSAKDIILELLRRLSCKGGVGKIFEYTGDGIACLSVPERGTICNMGAELGATSSLFPSDEVTLQFLKAQGREGDFVPLTADAGASYDEVITIDLSALRTMVALPHLPDHVVQVEDVAGKTIDQVFIGSCTSASYLDFMRAAAILKGHTVHPEVSLCIAPGSKQVFSMVARNGALADMIASGARILESACGPCVGIGQAPCTGGISLRTSNRNFEGRSGTKDAQIHLVSVETAAASAIRGVLTDPTTLNGEIELDVPLPDHFIVDDNMIQHPPKDGAGITVVRGPNIVPLPLFPPMDSSIHADVLLKVGDQITTDHIAPAGAKILPLRSNIPAISKYCFTPVDPTFPDRAMAANVGIIVGGENYGQGSSREHAALCPQYLGIRAVIVKSYARIHRQNLINCGILPLVFENPSDYDRIEQGDSLLLDNLYETVEGDCVVARFGKKEGEIRLKHGMSPRQIKTMFAGGILNRVRHKER